MKKLLAILLGALTVSPVFALTHPVPMTWTRPTTYVDGQTLPAADILSYSILCTFTPNGGTGAPCSMTPGFFSGSATTGSVIVTYPNVGGQACFRLTTRTAGSESDPSNEACAVLPALKPNPPGNLTITITANLTIDVNGAPQLALSVGPKTFEVEAEDKPLF
jgi:hypothetical protein